MPVEKVYFRDMEAEINTGTEAAPVWTAIGHKKTVACSFSANQVDLTDWESGGNPEHAVMSRAKSFTVGCFRMEDVSTGNRDAGQEAVEALGDVFGSGSLGQFRLTSPGGELWTFHASASVTPFAGGGGQDEAVEWSAELPVSGAVTKV